MARKSTVTIVSVYPRELKANRPYGPIEGQGSTDFILPAAPKDGYSKLVVEDCFQGTYYGENVSPQYRYDLVKAQSIADDIVNIWTKKVVGADSGFGPGIFIAEGDEPTQMELRNARDGQELYFEYLINQAETKYRVFKFDEITDTHRAAAVWMGREEVEWLRPIRRIKTKECPLCITNIPEQAVVCPNCKRDIAPQPSAPQPSAPNKKVAEK